MAKAKPSGAGVRNKKRKKPSLVKEVFTVTKNIPTCVYAPPANFNEKLTGHLVKYSLIKGEAIVPSARKSYTEWARERFNQRLLKKTERSDDE